VLGSGTGEPAKSEMVAVAGPRMQSVQADLEAEQYGMPDREASIPTLEIRPEVVGQLCKRSELTRTIHR